MDSSLININKINLPDRLILIPQFLDQTLLQNEIKNAKNLIRLLGARLIIYRKYSILTGFLGYPFLLTLFEFIENCRGKTIYFVGTCGCLDDRRKESELLTVAEIYSSSILQYLTKKGRFSLVPFQHEGVKIVNAVTVDIPQRENRVWLDKQRSLNIYCVEMELFPFRWYLGKEFSALLITTDRVTENGIYAYPDRNTIGLNFNHAFKLVKELCNNEA